MHRALVFLALSLLGAAACAPAAPSPTAPPPKPTEAPKPVAKPTEAPKPAEAKPAPKPTEAPAAKAAEKPADKPVAKPTEAPVAKPEDIRVPKPSGNLALKLGYPSAFGFSHMPAVITAERLNKDGWKIEHVNFSGAELNAEAASKGDTQIASGSSFSFLLAIQKGAKMALTAERNSNEWVLITRNEIGRCEDLAGKRFAIHSEGSTEAAMTRAWLQDGCKAQPNFIIIAGSENRAAALMNNQVDATNLELSDWINVNALQPGKFKVLVNYAQGLPDLSPSAYVVNTDWLEKNREVAVAFHAELLKTHRMVSAHPGLLEDATRQHVKEIDPKALPEIIRSYVSLDLFPPNGGLTARKVEGTIRFFTRPGQLEPGLAVDKAARIDVLEDALRLVGSVSGKP